MSKGVPWVLRPAVIILFSLSVVTTLTSGAEQLASGNEARIFDMSLEQLLNLKISVASKHDETVREAPAVMTVVTRKEIKALGARNLADIINRLPSMQVIGHVGFYANRTQIRAQPASSQDRHTLILLNGRPIRENINGGNNAYLYSGFPISAIESIEIIRGPGSVLYGTNAFAAVINIKTRKAPEDKKTAGKVGATYGTYNTKDFDALMMGRAGKLTDYLVAARTSRTDGPRIEWTDGVGVNGKEDYKEDSDSVYVNAGSDSYNLQASFHRYSPGEYGLLGRHSENTIYIDQIEAFFVDGGVKHDITENLSAHLNLTLNTFRWRGTDDGTEFFERRKSENLIIEPMLKYSPIKDMNFVLGGTLEHDKVGGRELYDNIRRIHSTYIQADYQITDWLKPVAGLQYNKTEGAHGHYSPRYGLVFTPGDNWGAKLLYSEAYRRPFPAEEFLNNRVLLGNKSLDPETIETYEAQINYQNNFCQFDLTAFKSEQHVIEVDFDQTPLKFVNHSGDLRVEGLELTGRYRFKANWQFLGSGMIQKNENNTESDGLSPEYPDYMLKGGVIGTYEAFTVGVFHSYFGKNSSLGDGFKGYNNLQAKVTVDLSRVLKLPSQDIEVALFGDNLLNEKPFLSPHKEDVMPQNYGRRIYLSLEKRW